MRRRRQATKCDPLDANHAGTGRLSPAHDVRIIHLHTNGRNAEIRAWVEEHPEVKERIEARIRNVPPQNRERAFINAAKSEAMNQTVRRNGNGVRP